jgi:hypothetical protein
LEACEIGAWRDGPGMQAPPLADGQCGEWWASCVGVGVCEMGVRAHWESVRHSLDRRPSPGRRLRPALSLCRAGLTRRPRASGGRWHPRSRRRYSLSLSLSGVARQPQHTIPKSAADGRRPGDRGATAAVSSSHKTRASVSVSEQARQAQRWVEAAWHLMAPCARHRQSASTWRPRRRATVWK